MTTRNYIELTLSYINRITTPRHRLPDGMALDLLKEITPVHFQAIFTTAYEKYAVQDIKFSAL